MRLPQRNRKTTDEMRVAEAKKAKDAEVLRRRQQLQRLQRMERARTASPKLSEASSARVGRVKPFQLASVMRHEREVQNRKQQLQVCSLTACNESALCAVLHILLHGKKLSFESLLPLDSQHHAPACLLQYNAH